MLRNVTRQVSSVHAPIRPVIISCTKPTVHRLFSAAVRSTNDVEGQGRVTSARPRDGRAAYKPKSSGDAPKSSDLASSPHSSSADQEPEARPKRLLEPHVLSKRLRKLCDEGHLDQAVDMLKNAPLDAQAVPVWNTLIWEALKSQRWNLSYKLFTDMKRRGLTPSSRTYQTMFTGLSHVSHWPTHSLQLAHAHQLYDYFLKHLQAVKVHKMDTEDYTISPVAKYIKILGDAGEYQKVFDVYYAMDSEGRLAPNLDIYTAMFNVLAEQPLDNEQGVVPGPTDSTAKLIWTQMTKACKKSPGFVIDSHLIAVAIKALSRGRPSDHELAFDIIRDHLGLGRIGETPLDVPDSQLSVHTLAAALELCNHLDKHSLCVHYLQQLMKPGPSAPKSVRTRGHIIDRGHLEQGFRAYAQLARAKVPGQSIKAVDMLHWMLKAEITQSNIKLRPRLETYIHVLSACRGAGDWAGATRTFELMTGYRAGDFADPAPGETSAVPVMELRSKGRNIVPNAMSMSTMIQTAIASAVPANVRQAIRMVAHVGIPTIATGTNGVKTASLGALFLNTLATSLEEGIAFLSRTAGRDFIADTRSWRDLPSQARSCARSAKAAHQTRKQPEVPRSEGKLDVKMTIPSRGTRTFAGARKAT